MGNKTKGTLSNDPFIYQLIELHSSLSYDVLNFRNIGQIDFSTIKRYVHQIDFSSMNRNLHQIDFSIVNRNVCKIDFTTINRIFTMLTFLPA